MLFDAGNPKAHYRRAQAHLELGNLALAHDDALRLLGLAPACSEVLQLRTRVALVEQRCAAEAAAAGAGRQVPQSLGEDTAAVDVLAVAEDVLAGAEDVKPGVGRAQLGVAPKRKRTRTGKKGKGTASGHWPCAGARAATGSGGPQKTRVGRAVGAGHVLACCWPQGLPGARPLARQASARVALAWGWASTRAALRRQRGSACS